MWTLLSKKWYNSQYQHYFESIGHRFGVACIESSLHIFAANRSSRFDTVLVVESMHRFRKNIGNGENDPTSTCTW